MSKFTPPDMRGWAAIGFFGVTFVSLGMIAANPALLAVPSFMQFIGSLAAGGVLALAAHLYGGTKSGTESQQRMTEALTKAAETPPVPPSPAPAPTAPSTDPAA